MTERSLWAMLRPRLKAITALWVITAMNTVIMWLVLSCSPMARPLKGKMSIQILESLISNLENRMEGERKK